MTIPVDEQEIEVKREEKVDEQNNNEREFPDPFYDPTTGQLMKDPVVNPAGDSYEKSTLTDNKSVTYYPNRALKSIIQRKVELESGSLRGRLRGMDEAIQQSFARILERSTFGVEHRPLPESYYCPITCELMIDPVISKDGNSYEREAIENWIRVNGVSPLTRNPLAITDLRDNNALYELIQEERARSDESMHPSIRRWKASGAPSQRPGLSTVQESPQPSAPPPSTDLPSQAATTTPSPGVTATSTSNYPTTEAEIRARRRRANYQCSTIAISFSLLLCVFLPGYLAALFLVIAIGLMIARCACCSTPN